MNGYWTSIEWKEHAQGWEWHESTRYKNFWAEPWWSIFSWRRDITRVTNVSERRTMPAWWVFT